MSRIGSRSCIWAASLRPVPRLKCLNGPVIPIRRACSNRYRASFPKNGVASRSSPAKFRAPSRFRRAAAFEVVVLWQRNSAPSNRRKSDCHLPTLRLAISLNCRWNIRPRSLSMCDTFVALPGTTATGAVLLAKNADTEINEAQHVLRLPRRSYPEGVQVRITHRVIPQARETYEVLLDKSFWLHGGEIGVNEHGVAIGNEAVFSNRPSQGDGVITIDMLRLMLERAKTKEEAVDLAKHLLSTYGQGGNCELRG